MGKEVCRGNVRLDASKTRFEEVSRSRHEESRSGPSESQDHEKKTLQGGEFGS